VSRLMSGTPIFCFIATSGVVVHKGWGIKLLLAFNIYIIKFNK